MILPDVNTLLYAVNRSSEQHAAALEALRQGFDDPRGVAFAWPALVAFLRLATRHGIFPKPLSVDDALRHLTESDIRVSAELTVSPDTTDGAGTSH